MVLGQFMCGECLHLMRKDPQSKQKNYRHLDFQIELAHGLIAGFSSRKWRSDTLQYLAARPAINESSHESVRMDLTRKTSRRCKWHMVQKWPRRETMYGCKLCNVYLCKDGCHITINNRSSKLKTLFGGFFGCFLLFI